jgi:DNA-binding transcriptional ArsR family regulator
LSSTKADLILHPARLPIIMALAEKAQTTSEIAECLPGTPKSSIYRHLRSLLEGGIVEVAETRPVKGVQEKFFRLAKAPVLSQADLKGFTRADHLRYFAMFLASQFQGFSNYLDTRSDPDFQSDRVGYSEAAFSVTPDELDRILATIRQVVVEGVNLPPAEDRRRHQIAFITYPVFKGEQNNE